MLDLLKFCCSNLEVVTAAGSMAGIVRSLWRMPWSACRWLCYGLVGNGDEVLLGRSRLLGRAVACWLPHNAFASFEKKCCCFTCCVLLTQLHIFGPGHSILCASCSRRLSVMYCPSSSFDTQAKSDATPSSSCTSHGSFTTCWRQRRQQTHKQIDAGVNDAVDQNQHRQHRQPFCR